MPEHDTHTTGTRAHVPGPARAWLVAPVVAGAACMGLGVVVGVESWAAWLHHPVYETIPELTRHGATLLRAMLIVGGLALMAVPLTLARFDPPADGPAGAPVSRREQWLVLGVVGLGLVVRATRLGESLWYDEIAAWTSYGVHGPGPIVGNYFDPSNHILHTLLTWVSVTLLDSTGAMEVVLRLPALLFSLASIVAVWGLARHAAGPRAGVSAALLGAALPVMVLESAEARGYSMMIFFAATSTWTFLAALRDDRAWQWTLYATLCALGVWTHFVTAFVPIGHAVWLAWIMVVRRERCAVLRGSAALALAAVVSIMLWSPALPDFIRLLSVQETFADADEAQPGVFGIEGLHLVYELGGAWFWWSALPGLALFIGGLVVTLRQERAARHAGAASLLGLPIMLVAVFVAGTWMYARFALFVLPGAIVMMAIALDALWSGRAWLSVGAGVVVVGAAVADLAIRPPKQPLREAAAYVLEPREPVVAIGVFHGVINIYTPPDESFIVVPHASDDIEDAIASTQPRFVVVLYPHLLTADRQRLLESRGYEVRRRFDGWADWGRGDVVVYERR